MSTDEPSKLELKAAEIITKRLMVLFQGTEGSVNHPDPNYTGEEDVSMEVAHLDEMTDKEEEFHVEEDIFAFTPFEWFARPSIKPDSSRRSAADLPLSDILQDIITQLDDDELYQYAVEKNEQSYFQDAYGGGENYRQLKEYFHQFAGSELLGEIYDEGNDLGNLTSGIGHCDLNDVNESITGIKKGLSAFEHYMEQYEGSVRHQLKQVEVVRSYIPAVLDFLKEEFFTDIPEGEEIEVIALSPEQEDVVADMIRNQLEEKGVDSPLILDQVRSSLSYSFSVAKGFAPAEIEAYFSKLGEHLQTNMDSAKAIQRFSADTRQHIDQIVLQESRKRGIEP